MPLFAAEIGKPEVARAYRATPLIALETDAPLVEVPAPVRQAADLGDRFDLGRWRRAETQAGAHGTIIWFPGERLIAGDRESIRRDLHFADQRTFVPVHLAAAEGPELVGLQPRWYAGTPAEDRIHSGVRIAAPADPGPLLRDFFEREPAPWARLYRALLQGAADARDGLRLLADLRATPGLHRTLDALARRNEIALLMRLEDYDAAEKRLKSALAAYPDYAELHYLAALVSLARQDPGRAIGRLQRATARSDARLVGSGGEASYRAHWLVATLSESLGNEAVAFHHFRSGLYTRPAFEPSVVALLKRRFSEDAMKLVAWELAGLARREPRYCEPVVYYLLLHGRTDVVRRILETHLIAPPLRAPLAEHFHAFTGSGRGRGAAQSTPGVCLTGAFFVHSSLARINRQLGAALLRSSAVHAGLEPHGFATRPHGDFADAALLESGLMRRPPRTALTIRHHWPPNFRRPGAGKLAVILPWEYGAAPRRWIDAVAGNVDELWVPSDFVRRVLCDAGAPAGRVRVIPNGVDTAVFRPEGERWRGRAAREFVFLFVGGAIARKGVDLLVKAYGRAFSARDDVSLVVKEIGSDTFYRHNSLVKQLRRSLGGRNSPHLEVLSGEIGDRELAGLYRGADAFVLPYRAEGFAMPVAEAMACGKPVIVTAAGPAPEFVPADLGYFVRASRVPVPAPAPPLGELVGGFTWFEPDVDELAARMREVYENRDEAARRGAAGGERIREQLGWERVCRAYLDRVQALLDSGGATAATLCTPLAASREVP